MTLVSNIIALIVLVIPPIGVWLLYRRRKRKINHQPAITSLEKTNINIDLKNAKAKYSNLFSKVTLVALLTASILTIGESIMDEKDKKLSNLATNIEKIEKDHGTRIKEIEDYLFPPGGPSSPALFKRVDELEKSISEIESIVLRLSDPEPELERKVHELETQIRLLRAEIKQLQARFKPVQRPMPGTM